MTAAPDARPAPPARLRPADVPRLARIGAGLLAYRVLARRVSVPRLMRSFDGPAGRATGPADAERLVWLVDRTLGRLGWRDACLPRSLVLFRGLRRAGHAPRVCVGVARARGVLRGHAWLELGGRPFAEACDPYADFRVLYAYPA